MITILDPLNNTYKKPVPVQFEGIDYWNRPVFKQVDGSARFGSVDILCDSKEEALERLKAADLVYFGQEFDCEPMGTSYPVTIIKGQ